MAKNIRYAEPADYFPKEIRKKAGIGEFAKSNSKAKIADKTKSKSKPAKKEK